MAEDWHEGHNRFGDHITIGNGNHCAGCGQCLGVFTISIPENWTPPPEPPEPRWPFPLGDCPLCFLRDGGRPPEPTLQQRLALFKHAKRYAFSAGAGES